MEFTVALQVARKAYEKVPDSLITKTALSVGLELLPHLSNTEVLRTTLAKSLILVIPEAENDEDDDFTEKGKKAEAAIKAQLERAKKQKLYTCPNKGCGFTHSNKYYKPFKGQRRIDQVHEQDDCPHKPNDAQLGDDDSVEELVAQRQAEADEERRQRKAEALRLTCPYGCGRTYANKHAPGAKAHLLTCPAKDLEKLGKYFPRV